MNIFKIFQKKEKADERVAEIQSKGGKPTTKTTTYKGKTYIVVYNGPTKK